MQLIIFDFPQIKIEMNYILKYFIDRERYIYSFSFNRKIVIIRN